MGQQQIDYGFQIKNVSVVNADVSAVADIALSKLHNGTLIILSDGSVPFAADQSMGGFKLTNLATGTNPADAVTFAQLSSLATGMQLKPTAQWATTVTLPSSPIYNNGASGVGATYTNNVVGALAVDGGSPVVGDLLLVKNESVPAINGLYVVTAVGNGGSPWVLTRSVTMDQAGDFPGALIVVENGTVNAGTAWLANPTTPFVVGTTNPALVQLFNPAGVSGTPGQLVVFNAGSVATGTTLSGAVLSVSSAGVVALDPSVNQQFSNFACREVPAGTINGSNAVFTLAHTPVSGTESVYLNGVLQNSGGGLQYTISGGTITFAVAPAVLTDIRCTYWWA